MNRTVVAVLFAFIVGFGFAVAIFEQGWYNEIPISDSTNSVIRYERSSEIKVLNVTAKFIRSAEPHVKITAYVNATIDKPVELVSTSVYIYKSGRTEKVSQMLEEPPIVLVPNHTNKVTLSFPVQTIPDEVYVVLRYEENVTLYFTIPKTSIEEETVRWLGPVLFEAKLLPGDAVVATVYAINDGGVPVSVVELGIKFTQFTCKKNVNVKLKPGESKVLSVYISSNECPPIENASPGDSVYVFIVTDYGQELGMSVTLQSP